MDANLNLLMAIRKKNFRQKDFAKAVGDHHTFVSRVINGWINLDEKRKAKYAKTLGHNVEDLFNKS